MPKILVKILRVKHSQKLLDHTKRSATDALKTTSKYIIHKSVEGTGDLISKKFPDKIIKISRTPSQNALEKVTNEMVKVRLDTEMPKEISIDSVRRRFVRIEI